MNQNPTETIPADRQESGRPLLRLPRIRVTTSNWGTGLEIDDTPDDGKGPSPEDIQKMIRGNFPIPLPTVRITHL